MNQHDNFDSLTRDIHAMPVFSDHEHHLPDASFRQPVTLTSLLAQSYVGWLGYTPGETAETAASSAGMSTVPIRTEAQNCVCFPSV